MRTNTLRFIVISLVLGVVVAIAGHYYATHDPKSKKDIVFAYLLGVNVAIFCFLYLIKVSAARLKKEKSLETLATEIQQEIPAYYDHDFYFNRFKKGLNIFIYITLLAVAIYMIWLGRLIIAGLLIVPFSFVIPFAIKDFLDKGPQLRIADKGIWLKDSGFTPWEKIRLLHVRKDRSGKSETAKFDIFLLQKESKNADISMNIDELKQWKDIGTILEGMGKTEVKNDY